MADTSAPRRSTVQSTIESAAQLGWEDPEDTTLLDEGGDEESDAKLTIYKDQEEIQMRQDGQAASSSGAVVKQLALCGLLITISIYESVFKGKATKMAKFDFTSLLVVQAMLSIVVGTAMAFGTSTWKQLFDPQKPTAFLWELLMYAPIGFLFSVSAYVQMIAFTYLAPDVFKVLEQGRLLMTAIVGIAILGKRPSISSWVALVGITLVAISYGQVRVLDGQREEYLHVLSSYATDKELRQSQAVAFAAANQTEGGEAFHEGAIGAGVTKKMDKGVEDWLSLTASAKNPMVGYALTLIFIIMSCFAGVYSEKVLKGKHHCPFYIQKVFLEIPAGTCAVLCTLLLRPILIDNNIAVKKLSGVSMFKDGLFAGWNNQWVILTFVLLIIKSWLSGIICKQLSAIAKQLCSITAVVVLYFILLLHACKNSTDQYAMWCPDGLGDASFNVIILDAAVMCSVVAYTTALRDKQRKVMFKKQLAQALEEAKAGSAEERQALLA